jgi:hypothetical protein
MVTTTVVNLKTDDFDVYIGRGSKWGNPFSHLDRLFPNHKLTWVPTRAEAVERIESGSKDNQSYSWISTSYGGSGLVVTAGPESVMAKYLPS